MPDQNSGSHDGGSHLVGLTGRASLREFARILGVSDMAVRKAIRAGRLQVSLGKTADGRPVIVDIDRARAEWTATSRTATGVRTEDEDLRTTGDLRTDDEGVRTDGSQSTDDGPAASLIDAQRLATRERYRKLKLENDVAEGRLIPVHKAAKEAFEAERTIREAILNLPARLSGELAAESDAGRIHLKLDAALREALTAAADTLVATIHE